jgi:hypothetical protein
MQGGHQRERSRSLIGPRNPSPSPSAISRSYSPGRRTINLDDHVLLPPAPSSAFSHSSGRHKIVLDDPEPSRPMSAVPSQRGSTRPDLRRQASASSIGSRKSGFVRYDPAHDLDPAYLASPAPERAPLPPSGSDPAMYGHRRASRGGSSEAGEHYGYPMRPESSQWHDARRFTQNEQLD